jgi:phytoene synthase
LAGEGHDAAVVEAGRLWALTQTGRADEATAQVAAANAALKALPPAAFPAVAHATLTRTDEPEPLKRLRLVWSVLRGRV